MHYEALDFLKTEPRANRLVGNESVTSKPKFRRRGFQFSLRTLMIATLVVAIPCAWVGRMIAQKRQQLAAVEALRQSGGVAWFDYQIDPDGLPLDGDPQPPGPAWLRPLLGNDFFAEVAALRLPESTTDDDLQILDELTQLKTLILSNSKVTDAGLTHLRGLTQLKELRIDETRITDAGVPLLKGLARLEDLRACYTHISKSGFESLQRALPNCGMTHE